MRNKITAIIQLIIGILGIISFIIITLNDENTIKWIGALILSIAFVFVGFIRLKEE